MMNNVLNDCVLDDLLICSFKYLDRHESWRVIDALKMCVVNFILHISFHFIHRHIVSAEHDIRI